MLHLVQLVHADAFVLYDYGSPAANRAHYGCPSPPDVAAEYWRIDIPVHLVAGSRDGVIPPPNVQRHLAAMRAQVRPPRCVLRVHVCARLPAPARPACLPDFLWAAWGGTPPITYTRLAHVSGIQLCARGCVCVVACTHVRVRACACVSTPEGTAIRAWRCSVQPSERVMHTAPAGTHMQSTHWEALGTWLMLQ